MSFSNVFNRKSRRALGVGALSVLLAGPMLTMPQQAEAGFMMGYIIGSSGGSRGQSASYYELNEALTDLSVSKARIEKAFEGRNIIRLENLDACRQETGVPAHQFQ